MSNIEQQHIDALLRAAIDAEREACASLCESLWFSICVSGNRNKMTRKEKIQAESIGIAIAEEFARAIRMRNSAPSE